MMQGSDQKKNEPGLLRAVVLLWLALLILLGLQLHTGKATQWPLPAMCLLFGIGALTLSIYALLKGGAFRWWQRRRDRQHSMEARVAFEQRLLRAVQRRKKRFVYKIPPATTELDRVTGRKGSQTGKRK
jgi:uncharacterized iron-regulated membrane protein